MGIRRKHMAILPLTLILVTFLALGLVNISPVLGDSNQTNVSETPTPEPIPTQSYEEDIARLEREIEILNTSLEQQTEFYNSTVSRMESNFNQLLAIISIVSVVLAILGVVSVRMWISNYIEKKVKEISTADMEKKVGGYLDQMRDKWEKPFKELYEEYRRIVRNRG